MIASFLSLLRRLALPPEPAPPQPRGARRLPVALPVARGNSPGVRIRLSMRGADGVPYDCVAMGTRAAATLEEALPMPRLRA